MTSTVRKAVIPAAGFGTRFLPATKAIPKEMLPLVDKPVIQYVVEEAVASGITDILIVISRTKRTIEEHFDRNPELERVLAERGRQAELDLVRSVAQLANVHFAWQHEQRGLGDAVACARAHVGNEPFAVLLGDTVTVSPEPVTAQLMRVHAAQGGSVVAVEAIDRALVSSFGVVDGRELSPGLLAVNDFVEKPAVDCAPSNLIISGRYIFTPDLFVHLANTPRGVGGELQLTDAMRRLVKFSPMFAWCYPGHRYDIGNKLDFVLTNVAFALQRAELRGPLAAQLKALLRDLPA